LRSGPAAHAHWSTAFKMIQRGDVLAGFVELTRVRDAWMDTAARQMRAARHYESVAQIFVRQQVMALCKVSNGGRRDVLSRTSSRSRRRRRRRRAR